MKRLLASLLLILSLFTASVPFAMAADDDDDTSDVQYQEGTGGDNIQVDDAKVRENAVKDSSSFNVFDILSIDADHESTTAADLQAEADAKGTSPIGLIILKAINIMMLLIGTFAFIMIIIGGVIFATAGGEESSIDRGKAILSQSIIGLVVAFMSYMIVAFIQSFFY